MICPHCGSYQVHTVNSRPGDGLVRRRKECDGCSRRFSTIELPVNEYTELKQKAEELSALCKDFEERATWLRIKYSK